MRQSIHDFLKDDRGSLIGPEWAFVATVLVLVGAAGWFTLGQALLEDLELWVTLAGR